MPLYRFDGDKQIGNYTDTLRIYDINSVFREVGRGQTVELNSTQATDLQRYYHLPLSTDPVSAARFLNNLQISELPSEGDTVVYHEGDWITTPAPTTSGEPDRSIEPPLRVDGTVLRDATNRRVALVGPNVQMVPYYGGGGPGGKDPAIDLRTQRNYAQRDAEFAALKRYGYNSIRFQIGLTVYNSETYHTKVLSRSRVEAVIASAKAAGLITMIAPDARYDMATYTGYYDMFDDYFADIGDDPWVIWEMWNEPADYSGPQTNYRAAMKGMGAHMRTEGLTQVIFCPGNQYQGNFAYLEEIEADATTNNWRGKGLVWSAHLYQDYWVDQFGDVDAWYANTPAVASTQGMLGDRLALWPMAVTEIGPFANSSAD